ncbi:MAG: hypothetical protein WD877_02335 [Candidatus Saccharimonadales bacterium]
MPLSPEQSDRLKAIAKYLVAPALGTLAAKTIYERGRTRHVSYWEASQGFFIDLVKDGHEKVLRLSGKVHANNDRSFIEEIELDDSIHTPKTPKQIQELEAEFLHRPFWTEET